MAVAYERSQVLDFRRNTEVSCPLRTEELLTPEIKNMAGFQRKFRPMRLRGVSLLQASERKGRFHHVVDE